MKGKNLTIGKSKRIERKAITMKGRLEEIISKALYADDPELYTVEYRDFDKVERCNLKEFLGRSENFSVIPASRIIRITKEEVVLFERRR